MIVAVTVGTHTDMPDHCPFQYEQRTGQICNHPDIDVGRQSLYCNYTHSPEKMIDAPIRCPLIKHSVDGIRVEAILR